MFLKMTKKRNMELVDTAADLLINGTIIPNTYVIDYDRLIENAAIMLNIANKNDVELLFMTKQIGRNPYISKKLIELGYSGAVAVDYKEVQVLLENEIPVKHCGNLVQIPDSMLDLVVGKVEYITVYSTEKAEKINKAAQRKGVIQKIYLRVRTNEGVSYPATIGGFLFEELDDVVRSILRYDNIKIVGLTDFPCFLYNNANDRFEPTENLFNLVQIKKYLEKNYDIKIRELNYPSATSPDTIPMIRHNGGTQGEPGHSLTGTTPKEAVRFDSELIPAMVFTTEVSHHVVDEKGEKCSMLFGGGTYPRGNYKHACIHTNDGWVDTEIEYLDPEHIDYHIKAKGIWDIGCPVVMSFRTQIFVTRSHVAVVEGISKGIPKIVGIYDSNGRQIS